MTSRFMLIFAAVSGFIFVALGAFGAHVLSKTLGVVEMGWIRLALSIKRSIRWLSLAWPSPCSDALAFGFTGVACFWH